MLFQGKYDFSIFLITIILFNSVTYFSVSVIFIGSTINNMKLSRFHF